MSELAARLFASREHLDQTLARRAARRLAAALAARGRALLAVSGGATPVGFFRRLARSRLAWERVVVVPVDERWVDPDHPDSNEALIRGQLLVGPAAAATLVSLRRAGDSPEAAARVLCATLAALGPFDLAVLGMGEDGHTASLFPGAPELPAALAPDAPPCLALSPPAAPHRRLSLSLRRLLESRALVVHIAGARKLGVAAAALAEGDVQRAPVAAVLRAAAPRPVLYWAP
ncbi:MAG: 6-phosphogluconolactonase [Porticoccaceae bacterium]|nr:MAG: 6-phosphogluconolactonase [Porticoccaceae bacterium]